MSFCEVYAFIYIYIYIYADENALTFILNHIMQALHVQSNFYY